MPPIFPSAEWLAALQQHLNADEHYAQIARNWEGDLVFDIQPQGNLHSPLLLYLDLWHGKCRATEYDCPPEKHPKPVFILRAPYGNFAAIVLGQLDPMTALLTNKLHVVGSMAYMLRNVPTVLDFVRCAREVSTEVL